MAFFFKLFKYNVNCKLNFSYTANEIWYTSELKGSSIFFTLNEKGWMITSEKKKIKLIDYINCCFQLTAYDARFQTKVGRQWSKDTVDHQHVMFLVHKCSANGSAPRCSTERVWKDLSDILLVGSAFLVLLSNRWSFSRPS